MSNSRPPKRQRIYRACDQCRRRKSKCDGEQPVCTICSQANRTCTYETGGGRRGLPSGYVRSLETTLGLMLQYVPNSESTIHNRLRDSRGKANILASKLGNQSVSIWRKSKLYRDVSQLLTPGSEDDVFDDSGSESAEMREPDEAIETMDDHNNMNSSNTEANKFETAQEPPRSIQQSLELFGAQIPDNTSELVDFYFTYTHCWFPILERRSVLRAMHIRHEKNTGDPSSQIVLLSLIAYTSAMKGISYPGAPDLFSLQLAIEQQAIVRWESLDLGHVQAMLILVLIQIALGNIGQAWTLIGKATRILETLPLSAKKGRLDHTFNGCVLLDNILSALLGRAPCLSKKEQLTYGPVIEDDLEEWDVWTPSRSGTDITGCKRPATPLRTLSISNHIQQLMQHLSVILYHPLNTSRLEELLDDLRSRQNILSRSHPYDRRNHANPPLLLLHLISNFTTLSLYRRFEPVSPAVMNRYVTTVHQILDLLDHYRETTGPTGLSPLMLCFALQCEKSIENKNPEERVSLQTRISSFLHPLKTNPSGEWTNLLSHPTPIPSIEQPYGAFGNSISIPCYQEISTLASQPTFASQPEPSSVINVPAISASSEFSRTGDAEMYDALFEEMVTSFPTTRQEPAFAHNLGFYDGDLDTDFLAQLQQPPAC